MFPLVNRTRCHAHTQLVIDARAEEHLLVVVKASFSVETGELMPVEAVLALADRYRGVPGHHESCRGR